MTQEESITKPPGRRVRLLFVDADTRVLNSLRAMFRRDYDVVVASQVHEALQALEDTRVDVIVADDRLPDTNGLDLLQWVQARAPHAARILMVAAGDQPYEPAVIRRAQLFRVLPKPCDPGLLKATIAQAERSTRVERGPARPTDGGATQLPAAAANDTEEHRTRIAAMPGWHPDNSGMHHTLDGADRTISGAVPNVPHTPQTDGAVPAGTASAPGGDVASRDFAASDAAASAGADRPAAAQASADHGEGVADATAAGGTRAAPPPPPWPPFEVPERPTTTRVWSAHGITVEEDAYLDPTDTQRAFARMVEQRRHRSTAGTAPPVESGQSEATAGVAAPPSPVGGGAAQSSSVAAGAPRVSPGTSTAAAPAPAPTRRPTIRRVAVTRVAPSTNPPGVGEAGKKSGAGVLILSHDAITRAEISRNLRGARVPVEASTAGDALDAVCCSECHIVIIDARRRPPLAVERTARLLLTAAPDLGILVLTEVSDGARFANLPDRVPGVISVLFALPTREQLLGAIAWADIAAASTDLQRELPRTRQAAVAAAGAVSADHGFGEDTAGGFGHRLRRVSRFWARPDNEQ